MNFQFSIFKQSKAFTIIELLVTTIIIGILSSVLFLGKTESEERLALQRSTYQLAQDLREVQGMAMGAGEVSCNGVLAHSFGIQFKASWQDHYILFADCDESHNRGGADEDIRTTYLEKKVKISNLLPSSSFSVVFAPPDPKTYIKQNDWNEEAEITLQFDSGDTKTVKINSAGRIEIK